MKPLGGARVVVTHHDPSQKSVASRYVGDSLNPAYVSSLDHLVDRSSLWVRGHVHSNCDYRIGDGRVVVNPRGYGHENADFDAELVVDV